MGSELTLRVPPNHLRQFPNVPADKGNQRYALTKCSSVASNPRKRPCSLERRRLPSRFL